MRALAFSRKRRQTLYGVAGGFGCLLIPTWGITQAPKSDDEPLEGYVSVRSCGAKGDGVADDTQPILADSGRDLSVGGAGKQTGWVRGVSAVQSSSRIRVDAKGSPNLRFVP